MEKRYPPDPPPGYTESSPPVGIQNPANFPPPVEPYPAPPYSPQPPLGPPPAGSPYPVQPPPPQGPPVAVHTTYVNPAVTVTPIPNVIISPPFGPQSVSMVCPHCKERVQTNIDKKQSRAAYLSSGGLCLIGCWCGCCLIPFCMDSCKAVQHTCPNCNMFLGKYSRY